MACGALPSIDKQICSFERWLIAHLDTISDRDRRQLGQGFHLGSPTPTAGPRRGQADHLGQSILRYVDYLPTGGFTTLNTISSIFSFVLGPSVPPFVWNVVRSYRYGRVVTVDDPWGHGNSLEWATSCPPPRHNFTSLPRIRAERPAFELHYPQLVPRLRAEVHAHRH